MTWTILKHLLSAAFGAGGLCLLLGAVPLAPDAHNLVVNSRFTSHAGDTPVGYELRGDAVYRYLGNPAKDVSGWGVALQSGQRIGSAGSVSQIVSGIDAAQGRWYRFSFRGLPQDHFAVKNNDLYMQVQYLGDHDTSFDGKKYKIYPLVEKYRQDLTVNGDHHRHGAEVWKTYQIDFWIPFEQVNRVRLSVGFADGAATTSQSSDFYVTQFSLERIAALAPDPRSTTQEPQGGRPEGTLLPLGGRWYYLARAGESTSPARFDYTNATRLYYYDGQYSTPFAGNMKSWLHAGNIDASGQLVTADRPVNDNVTVTFDATSLVIHTKGLPNHPTAKFPNTDYTDDDFDPTPIRERLRTYYIPLYPKENPEHIVTDAHDTNHALPMGPIGVAVNGVVFFNPFDANMRDASNIMDRCCGHPAPDGQYHYHKYPICINTPWADDGKAHSPLLGWMFDGYPIYGPYQGSGVMAKDVTGADALNAFNMHYDAARGWHYHVTPGKFPYLIGGYWGFEDSRDVHQGPRFGGGMGGPGGQNGRGGRFGSGDRRPNGPPPPGFPRPN